jgi:predicted GNAT family acetyltransferase
MRAEDEYPDEAGYPDGRGFLDEGTAPTGPDPLATELDLPSVDEDDEIVVVHDAATGTYRALLGEHEVAVMHAHADSGVVTLTSTVVEASVRGRGIATEFIAHVLDGFRDDGSKIVVQCVEVERFIEHYPEYADLVA